MRKYDPLNVDELGLNAARALMGYPAAALPPPEPFDGSGVYTLHYQGALADKRSRTCANVERLRTIYQMLSPII